VTEQAFDAKTAAARVVRAMLPLADATRAGQEKRYLKSDLDFLGVSLPGIRKVVTEAARNYRGVEEGPGLRRRVDAGPSGPDVWRDVPRGGTAAARGASRPASRRIQETVPAVKGQARVLRMRFSEVSV